MRRDVDNKGLTCETTMVLNSGERQSDFLDSRVELIYLT